jgi:hypothetical protein
MKYLLLLLCLSTALATTQERDRLTVGTTIHWIDGNALSPQMTHRFQEYVRANGTPSTRSSNWLGYHVDYRISNGVLRIERITIDKEGVSSEVVFGVNVPKGGMDASWYSGELFEPFGDIDNPIGVEPHERVFEFKQGKLVRTFERPSRRYEKLRTLSEKRG